MAIQGNGFRKWLSPYIYLSGNWISRIGVVLVTTGTVLWLSLLPVILRGFTDNPYAGILTFMGLPAVFFGGLILIPLGIVLRARRERHKGVYPSDFPPLDFRNTELRKLLFFVGVTTVVNLIIGAQLLYSGVNYMDSVTFCGKTCHTVMQPEYVAYEHSPHARVACVECHIGPGASWFVRSKLSGTYQVFATIFSAYPRPIPVPVTNLRPARQTCEQCHWPARFEGNRLVVIPHYADDEPNTLSKTVLLMHIGGGYGQGGIHGAHVGPGITIRYGSDESRQKMNWVEYSNAQTGRKSLFVGEKTDSKNVNPESGRVMDCIDCHNQPTHVFHLPGDAMDVAMATAAIPASLPFVKKEGLALLQAKYSSQSEAEQKISSGLVNYYTQNYPEVFSQRRAEVSQAVKGLVAIYQQNVFPQMKVNWGTYPDNLGHMNFPGCFRCHGTLHMASDSEKMITQDCNVCHNLLSMGEANPKILTDLGLGEGTEPSQ
ncbi:MAG TPA: NapC/NirT family cytochrome c [Terriglobia bacterium]|nr:NapC/NirT family cytochrome c [Terriglobia bacterium]